ncbi:hypothetical protein FSP39_015597 [Pinctada imbricata]|uniref:G-protein coupled receptors family 1 profile domain-containing protein n=1 Tax=Pinctada imbricata TaxID=66713 RepID=A0AA89BKS5_PINIB|nr:hypothetical protein FSP39_015597 [Pinctada imbricata]
MDILQENNLTIIIQTWMILQNRSFTAEEIARIYDHFLQNANASLDVGSELYVTVDLTQFVEYRIHQALQLYVPPLLLTIGIIGNVLSFYILRHKTMTRHTTNLFLAVLSIADSQVLFIGLFRKWIDVLIGTDIQTESDFLCRTVAVVAYTSSQFSVWLIVSVTVERYIVVCHALRASRICNIRRSRKLVVSLALVLFALNFHFFFTIGVQTEIFQDDVVKRCDALSSFHTLVTKVWPWIDALVYSIMPTLTIIVLNVLIIRQVLIATYGRGILQNGHLIQVEVRRQRTKDSNAKLTIMLLTVSFTFLVTTLPMNIVMITSLFSVSEDSDPRNDAKMWLIRTTAELLMYLNHSINFFLYCATGQKFRNIVIRLICRRSISNASNMSDHSQHLYCSRAYGVNGCTHLKNNSNEETAV